jgi:DNA polymerase-3 subunit chi
VSAAPRVEFRVGVADPLGYCCGLLRAADAKGARTVVCVPEAWLDELDQRLWTFSQPDFLAHCRVGESLEARSPIVLSERADVRGLQGRDCLVNLGTEEVLGWRQLPRVIELVGADAPAKAAARQRFRMYRIAGCEPHNVEP